MRPTVLLCVGWTLLVSLPARAELNGVKAYERGNYGLARRNLEDALRSGTLTPAERIKARVYLAAALHAANAPDAARVQLEELVITAPEFQVDPVVFPPDFVALAQQVRQEVDERRAAQERLRQEQERQRLEAERQRLEAERKAHEEVPPRSEPPPAEEQSPGSVRLRPELFGFVAPVGKGVGFGGALTVAFGTVDLSARVLAGPNLGVGAEVGFLLGEGSVQPRVGLRGTAVPRLKGFGGGAVAGLRLAPSETLVFLVDVGAEYLKGVTPRPSDKHDYHSFVLTGSTGVGFNLF